MTWSLLNYESAEDVNALLDKVKDYYPPDVKRAMTREKAASIIHACLWAYAAREDSLAGAYAWIALDGALDKDFDRKVEEEKMKQGEAKKEEG